LIFMAATRAAKARRRCRARRTTPLRPAAELCLSLIGGTTDMEVRPSPPGACQFWFTGGGPLMDSRIVAGGKLPAHGLPEMRFIRNWELHTAGTAGLPAGQRTLPAC
jgi:hypothetical protein